MVGQDWFDNIDLIVTSASRNTFQIIQKRHVSTERRENRKGKRDMDKANYLASFKETVPSRFQGRSKVRECRPIL